MPRILNDFIKWTNENSGFLSVIIFAATLIFGWLSGLFSSIIRKPKLKIRFIEKATFYSHWLTGEKYKPPGQLKEFDLHKTAFSLYITVSNIGNKNTTIDKVFIGYFLNSSRKKIFKRQMRWLAQWHSLDHFKFIYLDKVILLPPFGGRNEIFTKEDALLLKVGESISGVAYFEQQDAWGSYSPKMLDTEKKISIILKIRDIYGSIHKFKTKIPFKNITDAQKINSTFGKVDDIISAEQMIQ